MVEELSAPFASAEKLLARYEDEPEHVRQVARLAGELYHALGREGGHGYGRREREWLLLGALLHDIGWSQTPDGSGHHKWSAQLIFQHGLDGCDDRETAIVALIARYHRKALPDRAKEAHRPFYQLAEEDQKRVELLGGIVRVADALDRTHRQVVARADLRLEAGGCVVLANAKEGIEPEKAAVKKKGDLLALHLGRPVWCEQAKG